MNVRHLVHVIGLLLLALSGALLLSSGVAAIYGDGDFLALLGTAVGTAAIGFAARSATELERELSIREGFAIVSFGWLAVGIAGAVPYLLTGATTSPVAALFESISGFTTTGATVFTDIEALPRGLLFWRALTQWIGGMGIIVLGIAILPVLGVGGMQLFQAEVPGPTPERLQPRIAQTAKLLWFVYAGLTAVQALLLMGGGLSLYEAVTHAFTTLSTGGFSPRNASIAAYPSPYVQYVFIVFMYLAGVNFALHYRLFARQWAAYPRDPEWRFFTTAVIVATTLVAIFTLGRAGTEETFRNALFQTISIVTTTGYISYDYELWPLAPQVILLLLMFLGGMTGSTAGGIKAMRVLVLLKQGAVELKRSLHPRAVVVTRLGRKPLREDVLLNILGFVLLFLLFFALGVLALAMLGYDLPTAIGASAATIGNIGPGLGGVGAVDNYGWMGPAAHAVMIFLMLVGRLEIFTVLVLFHPDLWRRRGR